MSNNDNNFKLPGQLLVDLLNYLARHPYAEVWQIIQELQALQLVEVKEDDDAGSG